MNGNKVSFFQPKISISTKINHYPRKHEYAYVKQIKWISNTPIFPTFLKKMVSILASLYNKIEMKFRIREINNNNSSDIIYPNKYNDLFNKIDELRDKVKIKKEKYKNLYGKENIDELADKKIKIINCEINHLQSFKDLIIHANTRFYFYDLCDYLIEVKRAKDFFIFLNDVGKEKIYSKLFSETLHEIIVSRVGVITTNKLNSIYKLLNSKFNFEQIFSNKKYGFMLDFSTIKERDEFIKMVSMLVIAIDSTNLLDSLDNNDKKEIKKRLIYILSTALDKKNDDCFNFEILKKEWGEKYISDIYNYAPKKSNIENEIDKSNNDLEWDNENEINKNDLNDELEWDNYFPVNDENNKKNHILMDEIDIDSQYLFLNHKVMMKNIHDVLINSKIIYEIEMREELDLKNIDNLRQLSPNLYQMTFGTENLDDDISDGDISDDEKNNL